MAAIPYRASLDGLRAIAVAGVLVFHLQKDWLPGGFVGVDVFFVLSGYLITSIILAESEAGRFSFKRFYQRRISRIAPASFLVLGAVLLAASWVYLPQDFASAGAVATAAAVSLANMKLMLQGNYFEASADAQPLLHYWSLAVEEQFYLVLPLVAWACLKGPRGRRRLSWLLIASGLVSFVGCVYLTEARPSWAFYLLPTRAWELIAGCLLAIAVPQEGPAEAEATAPRKEGKSAAIGLLLIFASFVLLQEGAGFPGFVAAAPVVGTLLCIGWRRGEDGGWVEDFLSRPSLVAIGKASYSLYLWHWPVYCFVDYALFEKPFATRLVWKLVLTLFLSVLSYRLFETPSRRYLNRPDRSRLAYATFFVTAGVAAVIGMQVRQENFVNARLSAVRAGGLSYPGESEGPGIALIGDSNGSMYGRSVRQIAERMGVSCNVLSVAAGNPLPGNRLHDDTLAALDVAKPRVCVFVLQWVGKLKDDRFQLDAMLEELLARTDRVIMITQPPRLPENASREGVRQTGVRAFLEDPESASSRTEMNAFVRGQIGPRVEVIDIEELFVDGEGNIRFTDEEGRQLWQDKAHISYYGAEEVAPRLEKRLKESFNGPP